MTIDVEALELFLAGQVKLCQEEDELRAQRDSVRKRLGEIAEEMDELGSSIRHVLNQAREKIKN